MWKIGQTSIKAVRSPASILYKSIAGRYRPVSYPDGPITARYRFIKKRTEQNRTEQHFIHDTKFSGHPWWHKRTKIHITNVYDVKTYFDNSVDLILFISTMEWTKKNRNDNLTGIKWAKSAYWVSSSKCKCLSNFIILESKTNNTTLYKVSEVWKQ